jgi:hypothetical protein
MVTEEEVWHTIRSLPSDKALGSDGYTGRFYKKVWPIIKMDFMSALKKVWQGDASRLYLLNSAYVTLLPKKSEAIEVKDFRPISLIHSFAKKFTKILANRLAPKLPDLVSVNQSAFVKGRSIDDNFVMVQQTAKAIYGQKLSRILLKLDIGKTFDSVSWTFLFEVLRHLGFGPLWCGIISRVLSSSTTRVLVNGEPGDIIHHRRGLRQGDPLSAMLFIIVMDVLNSLILKAQDLGLLHPLLWRGRGQHISLYADDVVLFLKPERDELNMLKEILRIFGEATGLVANINKCSITPIHCNEQQVDMSQEIFPCNVQQFPCRYLGLPLSVKKLPKIAFQELIDKVADKLPG